MNKTNEGRIKLQGKYLTVWKQVNDKWKIYRDELV